MFDGSGQLLIDGIADGSRIALVAVGFSLIYGVTKTLHLAHGSIITLGSYLIWWFTATFSWPLAVAVLMSGVAVAVAGVGNEVLIYRRLRARKSSGLIIVVAALGVGIVLQNLLGVVFGFNTKAIRESTIGDASEGIRTLGVVVPITDLLSVAVCLALFGCLVAYLRWSKVGRQVRAVQSNPDLARVVGVDTPRVYAYTFALGSLVSLPAAFFIGLNSGLSTTIGFEAMLLGFVVAFAGGIGSLAGTMVASFGIGIVQSLSLQVIDSSWQATFTFGLLLILIILRPQGLFGRADS